MTTHKAAEHFFLVLLVASAVLLALVVRPIAGALMMGAVLAGVLWPLQRKLTKRLRKRRGLAAGALVAGVVVLLVGPLAGLSAFVVNEGTQGLKFVSTTVRSEGVKGLVAKLPAPVQGALGEAFKRLPQVPGEDLDETVRRQVSAQGSKAAAAVGMAVAATGTFLLHAAFMLIAMFFLLVQGDQFVAWLDQISPLRSGQTQELLADFKQVSYAVVVSSLLTAGVQAIAALVGYFIAQVPHPVFFGAVTFFCALIPAIGAASVCLVAALLLWVTGHPYLALFLSIWGVTIVALVDNVVKPLLMKNNLHMPGAVVFFALMGGLLAFGAVGLLIGPLAVSLFVTLVRMYGRDFGPKRPSHAPAAPA